MKAKLLIVLTILFMTIVSCKNEAKVEEVKEKKIETFDVTLNMIVKQDDNFQIFYTDYSTPSFDEKKSFWIPVKGSENAQDIVFRLPEDEIPTNIRLDLGNNPRQLPMKLNNFKMSFFGKSYELKDTLITKNFVIGDQLKYDKSTSTLTPNQGTASIYDPILYPQDNLKEEIEKLIK
jgi:hypothetical protein